MRYLVTGAQGFIGRYLVAEILRSEPGAEVFGIGRSERLDASFSHRISGAGSALARLPDEVRDQLNERYRYVQASILSEETITRLVDEVQPRCVVHLASGLRDDHDQDLVTTNVQGTAALMTGIAQSRAPRPKVVLGSSGGVYGRVPEAELPLRETACCRPADVYSVTKLAAEQLSRVLGEAHGIATVAARIFNVVGPGQDERHVCGRFATELDALCRRGEGSLRVGNLETTRDFVDVRDVAAALLLLARRETADDVYNVGSGVETPVRSVLELLITCSGYSGTWEQATDNSRQSDVPRHQADVSRLASLGFRPRYALAESLADLYAYTHDLRAAS